MPVLFGFWLFGFLFGFGLPNGSVDRIGIADESFRNYADYMLSDEFRQGVKNATGYR